MVCQENLQFTQHSQKFKYTVLLLRLYLCNYVSANCYFLFTFLKQFWTHYVHTQVCMHTHTHTHTHTHIYILYSQLVLLYNLDFEIVKWDNSFTIRLWISQLLFFAFLKSIYSILFITNVWMSVVDKKQKMCKMEKKSVYFEMHGTVLWISLKL